MKLYMLTEDIDAAQQALTKLVPPSIKSQYRGFEFEDVLTKPGEALALFRLVINRVDNDAKLLKITELIMPYLLRDLDRAFKKPDTAMSAYKNVYSLVYKLTTYDEWQSVDSKPLIALLDANKDIILKIILTELKSLLYNALPSHPTTIRLATVVGKMRSILNWPELTTIYLSLHNAVFSSIAQVTTQHSYNTERDLIDYISRNNVDLDLFPNIREQLNRAKNTILIDPLAIYDGIDRGMASLKLWVEKLKQIGLDWPELDNIQTVYNMAKPVVIPELLQAVKNITEYNVHKISGTVDLLINFFKVNWPELDVIKKSLNSMYKNELDEAIWPFKHLLSRINKQQVVEYIELWKHDPILTVYRIYNRDDAVTDHPMLEQFVNENKIVLVKELLKLVRDDPDDELNGLLHTINVIGIDWPELDIIKKSIAADKKGQ